MKTQVLNYLALIFKFMKSTESPYNIYIIFT